MERHGLSPPADPLVVAVRAAYSADQSVGKLSDKTSLAAVYRACAEAVPNIATAGALFQVVKDSSDTRIADRLKTVRSLFGTELGKFLPNDRNAILTAEQKSEAVKQLIRFATILDGVK